MKTIGLFLVAAAAALAQGRGEVIVKVTGVRNANGHVIVSVYHSKSGFLRDFSQADRTVAAPIIDGTATAVFAGLAPGTYAVAVVHDENRNGRFEASREGFGTSGAGRTFEDAKFQVNGTPKNVEVQLRYQ